MPFKITDHVEFDAKGRAICPACAQMGKTRNKNLSLIPNTDGAYKCHRGCSPEEIREAIGVPKGQGDRQVPSALAKPQPPITHTPQDRAKYAKALQGQGKIQATAREWLTDRGITPDLQERYGLGLKRVKVDGQMVPAIVIPIPGPQPGQYFLKYRLEPWGPPPRAWHQPGVPASLFWGNQPESPSEIWICEGEWDAMRLGAIVPPSISVVSFTCGCQSVPSDQVLAQLPKVPIKIFYDRDQPGQKGAQKLAKALGDRAKIAIVPGSDEQIAGVKGWDISNALDAGYRLEDFQQAQVMELERKEKSLKSRLITHAQLMARAPDYVDFLIPDLLTYELYLVAAPPRSGKTLLVMTLAQAIAAGGKFLERPTTQGSVLIINLEDSDAKVKSRALAQGWDDTLPVYWLDKFKLDELPDLSQVIDEVPDLRLIVIDTLSRAKSGNVSESSAEMSQLLEPLQELCKEREICCLLVHHTGKVKESDGHLVDVFDNIRGSSAIRATARGCWVILPGDNCYRLVTENGYSKEDLKIRLNPNTWEWNLLGKWSPYVDLTQREQILQHLNMVEQATVSQISESTGIPAKTVGTVLGRLQADDMIRKIGGRGRQPAVYTRSSNLLQLLEQKLEHPNPDTETDSGLLQQKNIFSNKDQNSSECDSCFDPVDPAVGAKDQNSVASPASVLGNQPDFDPNLGGDIVGAKGGEGSKQGSVSVPCSNFCSNNGQKVGASWSNEGTEIRSAVPVEDQKVGDWRIWTKIETTVEVIQTKGDRASIRVPGESRKRWVSLSELEKEA